MEISNKIEKEKQEIMFNFLKNAPFDGWNENNLKNSCVKIGRDAAYAWLIFPGGVEDLNLYFHEFLNQQMEFAYQNCEESKIHKKIIFLLEKKFEVMNEFKEAITAYLKYSIKPGNILKTKSYLWDSCSRIWYLVGDNSTDFNYYTKRSLLAGVYSSSLIYFLNDNSENFEKTRAFIRRRIANVLSIGKIKGRILTLFGR